MRHETTFILVVLAASIARASCAGHAVGQRSGRPVAMPDLTVPEKQLPSWCALAPADSERMENGRTRVGIWAGFPANPWLGADRHALATIRERIDGAPLVPDGPPPGSAAVSRYYLQLADGVAEGYAAIYSQSGSPQTIVVYGLRFADGQKSHPPDTGANPQRARFDLGPIVVSVSGDGGACFQAVRDYEKALGRR